MSNLKVLKGRWFLILLIVVTLPFSSPATPLSSYNLCATPMENPDPDPLTNNEWRIYDVNGDGKFDASDINEFVGGGGINFINDLNSDGSKDLTDAFALYVKLTVLDRSCDEAVDNNDFTPIDPVVFPEPDAAAVWPLVSKIVANALTTLPADIEDQVFRSLPDSRTMTFMEKAAIYMETGMSALFQKNLEGAQWAYGRAYQTNNRSASALGSLAFTIAVDKRHEEALTLLAYARELFRESGAISTNIGWIFARHGQNREALTYYQEAVEHAPKIAQYHFNLGVAYLRVGSNKEACKEFKIAAELDPGDFKAFLFGYVVPEVVPPPSKTPIDLVSLKKEYELQISKLRESGATEDELPTQWNELSPCELAKGIAEMLDRKCNDQSEKIGQSYADETAEKLNKIALGYAPQWKKVSEDWERYRAWLMGGRKAGEAIVIDAENALGDRIASLTRQTGREIVSYSEFYMECALKQAKADADMGFKEFLSRTKDTPLTPESYAETKADFYQSALVEALEQCYQYPMTIGTVCLKAESEPAVLPVSHVKIYPIQYFPLAIPDACINIQGYCEGEMQKPEYGESTFDNTFTLDLILASLEYNTSTGEWEFRVGQGIILGATWSPESGFGVQLGVGVHAAFIGVNYEAAAYLEGNSEGLTAHLEGGASTILGPGLEKGIEHNVIQLEHVCTAMEPCSLTQE
jgi:tetratricopeptide (TPR) repeat protein